MSEGTQTIQQQTQDEQYLHQAQDYFGQSMGRIKGRMQSDSAQLQSFIQQLPPDAQAQIQEMTNSYAQFENTINQAAQDAGVQDSLEESAQQARQNADQASGQGPTDVAADQAQQVAAGSGRGRPGSRAGAGHRGPGHRSGRSGRGPGPGSREGDARRIRPKRRPLDQAQDVAGQMAESLPEGDEALGQPFTDEQGNTILQGQDEEGNTAIVRRGTDEAGNTIDSIFDAQGNLLDENIIEEVAEDEAEEGEEPEDMASQMAEACPRVTR